MTVYTWDQRQMPTSCVNTKSSRRHGIYVPQIDRFVRTFRYGDVQLKKFSMDAGQTIDMTVEFNFANSQDENIPNDWSVVAWAPNGSIEITNQDGSDTDHLPFISSEEFVDRSAGVVADVIASDSGDEDDIEEDSGSTITFGKVTFNQD